MNTTKPSYAELIDALRGCRRIAEKWLEDAMENNDQIEMAVAQMEIDRLDKIVDRAEQAVS